MGRGRGGNWHLFFHKFTVFQPQGRNVWCSQSKWADLISWWRFTPLWQSILVICDVLTIENKSPDWYSKFLCYNLSIQEFCHVFYTPCKLFITLLLQECVTCFVGFLFGVFSTIKKFHSFSLLSWVFWLFCLVLIDIYGLFSLLFLRLFQLDLCSSGTLELDTVPSESLVQQAESKLFHVLLMISVFHTSQ